MFKRLLIVLVGVLFVGWMFTPPQIPQKIQVLPLNVDQFPINNNTTQTYKDRIVLPNNMLCPEWAQLAVNVGWEQQDLAQLDSIIYRESRCFTWVHYSKDPNGGSFGLTQVNAYWCKPSKWYPNGYLQTFGVLNSCEELYFPRVNLLAARLIWLYSHKEYGNGWLPWRV